METSMGLNNNDNGGLSTGLTRMMTGQNLMVSDFTYSPPKNETTVDNNEEKNVGTVCLGTWDRFSSKNTQIAT